MNKITSHLLASALVVSFSACQNPEGAGSAHTQSTVQTSNLSWDQPFIPVDSADTLIKSYLTSINYQSQDTDVRSFIIDANALRQYLTAGNGEQITNLKIMLAHNADYIQSGHYGQPCGYSKNGLTVVLAGYGSNGNYIYAPGNKVLDYSMPCPANCPNVGTASGDLLPN